MSLFGPLFRYELTRLARRGAQPKFRAAFAVLLLVALFLAYLAAFPGTSPLQLLTELNQPLSIEAGSKFGERFVASTALTSTEIVVGKLAARLVFVWTLLLTGLPVVALMTFFGGVDIGQLAAGYAVALFSVLSLGAVSLFLSVVRKTVGSAIILAYIFALSCSLFGMMCSCLYYPAFASPIAVTWVLLNGWPRFLVASTPADLFEVAGAYAALHTVLAVIFIALSVWRVRYAGAPPIKAPPIRQRRERPSRPRYEERPDDMPYRRDPRDRMNSPSEIDEHDPLGWKERHFGGFIPELPSLFGFQGRLVILAGALGLAFCCCLSRVSVVIGFLGATLIVGLGTSATIARERQRGTLESLLTLPVDRREILWAKLRIALISGGWVALISLGLSLVGLPTGLIAFETLFALPFLFAGWMLAAGGFGLWLSVWCATVERAMGYWLVTAVLLCILPPMLSPLVRESSSTPNAPSRMHAVSLTQGFSPVVGVVNAFPSLAAWDRDSDHYPFQGAIFAAMLAGLVGVFFGWLAVRRFERNVEVK
ncbi:MAG: ABC transporter permease subunit [Planctomycetes bacterium]|nr:ABC transporter permease subunit [Planctomycetota bacterium]